jgi:hypothetical protein
VEKFSYAILRNFLLEDSGMRKGTAKWILFFLLTFTAGSFLFVSCGKKQTTQTAGPVTFDWDKGPTEIDAQVAKYPKQQQDTYNNIIKVKCIQCHSLARVLWAPYYDNATLTKIVTKMGNRPGSQVTNDEIPKVIDFLLYDHTQRQSEIEKTFQTNHWQVQPPVL